MLEASRVCRVSSDRNIDILVPHDCHSLAYIVCAVAFYDKTLRIVSVRDFLYNFESLVCSLAVEVVKLSLNISESVDAADNLRSVFSKAVQDNAELVLAYFVSVRSNFDCALSGCERLVSCQESEALCLLRKKTRAQVSVSETYFAVVSYRAWQAECLKAFSDVCGSC